MADTLKLIDAWLHNASEGNDPQGEPLPAGRKWWLIDSLLDRRIDVMAQRGGTATGSKSL